MNDTQILTVEDLFFNYKPLQTLDDFSEIVAEIEETERIEKERIDEQERVNAEKKRRHNIKRQQEEAAQQRDNEKKRQDEKRMAIEKQVNALPPIRLPRQRFKTPDPQIPPLQPSDQPSSPPPELNLQEWTEPHEESNE